MNLRRYTTDALAGLWYGIKGFLRSPAALLVFLGFWCAFLAFLFAHLH